MRSIVPLIITWMTVVVTSASASAADADLARQGYGVLQKYCFACHGDDFKYPGFDLRDRVTLLQPKDQKEAPFLVPGKPDDSRVWKRAGIDKDMPPEDQPQPSAEEKSLLKKWIAAGAEFPPVERPKRAFIGERTLLKIIADDLDKQPDASRPYLRYFALGHLWNSQLSDEQLRITRAAVSKLINSLSSQPRIAVPHAIDADGVVLRVDLRDYGWTNKHHWRALLKSYPYGIQVGGRDYERVYRLTDCDLPYLRADWFVFNAARPPLYHQLVTLPDYVGIPEKLPVLERLLGVDLQADFQQDRLWRAAFSGEKSGVSDHNRMVERHDARYGYYWPSYDSAGDQGRQSFFQFPLGPKFPNSKNIGAFEHDGGEMIFSLPNRLQAYMLSKSDGTRIDVGPQTIVQDPQQFSGTYDVVNGISCMGCHRHGMITFTDSVRPLFENRSGEIAEKVLRLFPETTKMNELIDADRKQFLGALDKAVGPFLRTGPNDKREVTDLPEPVTATSKQYDRPIRLADVARELGLPDDAEAAKQNGLKVTAGELGSAIKFSERLRNIGLAPLSLNEPLTRKQWESAFQPAARETGVGIPIDVD